MRTHAFLLTTFLALICASARADEFSESFDGGTIDPETLVVAAPTGFDVSVVDGKAVTTKLEGTENGFAYITTTFTIKGDFEASVVVERTTANGGTAMGIASSHFSPGGFTDVYFSGTGNLTSFMFVTPLNAVTTISAPSATLKLRIRRTGNHLIHEYDSGSGFTMLNEITDPVLGSPVTLTLFLGQEANQTTLERAKFDDFVIEGDVFTPPCGNGFLEEGEVCDDDDPAWTPGDFCSAACEILHCGDPDDSGTITVVDALHTLRTGVGTKTCDECICNVDSSTGGSPTTVSDALRILRKSVGQTVELICPPCA